MLNVVSLAHATMAISRGWCADSPLKRVQLAGELDQAKQEVALLREEMRIKDARMARIPAHQRPFYPPIERMAVLELKAARGWSLEQAAKAFLVDAATVASWMKRIDEGGEQALVKLPAPVNKYPAFVAHIVQRLKVLCPTMGKKRIAQTLARAGIAISTTSAGRWLAAKPPPEPQADKSDQASPAEKASDRVVTAEYPHHVWHLDLTLVPTAAGFWLPWLPMAMLQCWPFCWWVACAMDHYSRRIVGFELFKSPPSSRQITAFLNGRTRAVGQAPKHVVTDKGSQFWCEAFKLWCKRRKIRPRFGAVGKYGSIAVIERLIRSLKSECTRRLVVPLAQSAMLRELDYYDEWFNTYRPHQGIGGLAPAERNEAEKQKTPAYERRRRNSTLQPLILDVSYFKGRKHLPIVRLKPAA